MTRVYYGRAILLLTFSYTVPVNAAVDVDVSVDYVADITTIIQNGNPARTYALDNLDLMLTADLGRVAGGAGTTVHAHLLNNLGQRPNDVAGTLQGVDNIEVASQRLRLFELWAEQRVGARTTLRAGLYDLNSEFYANDAAGLLIAPAFGVGSEIAATGPNGPSIFPSTALAVRLEHRPDPRSYLRVAAVNARAGTLGDPEGVNLGFGDGALLIGEVGVERAGRIAVGIWAYSSRQPHIRRTRADGLPARARALGAYASIEWPLMAGRDAESGLTGFVRVGGSDGRTTPFRGGWQAGLLWRAPLAARPESALSLGLNQGRLSKGYRRILRELGTRPSRAETAIELTASDRLMPHLTVQPDLQLVLDAGGVQGSSGTVVGSVRVAFDF